MDVKRRVFAKAVGLKKKSRSPGGGEPESSVDVSEPKLHRKSFRGLLSIGKSAKSFFQIVGEKGAGTDAETEQRRAAPYGGVG